MKTTSYLLSTNLALMLFGCKEKIVEYHYDPSPIKPGDNDQYHGDIIGRVVQKESNAKVYLSQVSVIDSSTLNPAEGSFIFHGVRLGNYDLSVNADNYRNYIRSNVIVPGGGIAYVGEIDLSTTPDLIAKYYPSDNSEIVYNNRFARLSISFLFTQPMDRASVERAFSTNPPSTGIFYWGSYIYSPIYSYYSDLAALYAPVQEGAEITTYSKITSVTYILSRKDSYVDTTYTITLSTEAMDTTGNHLRFPLVSTFKTVQAGYTVYGIQSEPVDGDVDVNLLSFNGISVTFPRRMDPVSTEQALSVTPNDNRAVLWPSGNQMAIYTGGVYRADTLYTILIDSIAEDLDGNLLGQQFSFSFRTAPVQVLYTTPNNAQMFVRNNTYITLQFNTYVLKSSIQNAFSISPPVPGTFEYGSGYGGEQYRYLVTFKPSIILTPNTKYTITLSTVVQDMFGTNMKKPFAFSFITSPE